MEDNYLPLGMERAHLRIRRRIPHSPVHCYPILVRVRQPPSREGRISATIQHKHGKDLGTGEAYLRFQD